MFKIMEDIRDEFHGVEDYSISETSLEQVFISFAKNQTSTEEGRRKSDRNDKSRLDEDEDAANGALHEVKLERHLSNVSRVSEKLDSDNNSHH